MADLVHVCDVCGQTIEPHLGSLFIRNDDVQRAEVAFSEDVDRDPMQSLAHRLEHVARWRLQHDECSSEAGDDSRIYDIELTRLLTYGDLVVWTHHLMEKRWLPATDWRQVLGRYAAGINP